MSSDIIRDENVSFRGLAIVDKYEQVIDYLYPILQNVPRKHGVARGYRVWPRHKLLRRQSVDRAKRKIARYRDRGQVEDLRKFTAAWRGHAQWADTYNLRKYLELVEDDRNANHQFAR